MKELTVSTNSLTATFPFLKLWLEFQRERLRLPGLIVAIAKDGEVLFKEAFGQSNLEKKTAMVPDQLYRIASHSKTFATVALLQLYDAGKIDLDDPIAKFLPWLKAHSDPRMAKVTVRQILSNSSGMLRDVQDVDYWQLERPFLDESALQETVMNAPLFIDSATETKYSNTGFALVGMLVEKISGISFNDYVKERLLAPLELNSTGPEYDKSIVKRMVTGYSAPDFKDARIPFDQIDTRAMSPATGFYSCADDLLKFFSAISNESNSPINAKSKREMQQTQSQVKNITLKREYGLGLQIEYSEGKRYFGHTGDFPGQRTGTLCDVSRGLVLTIMTNGIEFEPFPFIKGIYSIIDFFENAGAPDERLRPFEGIYRNLWGSTQLVGRGNSLYSVDPFSLTPFKDADQLEYVDKYLVKIVKCGGYGNAGEFIRFKFDKHNAVESLTYGSTTMWPAKAYENEFRRSKTIALPK